MKLFAELLLLETAIPPSVIRFMQANGYSYKGTTMEDLAVEHEASCRRSGRLSADDIAFCQILKIPLINGKLAPKAASSPVSSQALPVKPLGPGRSVADLIADIEAKVKDLISRPKTASSKQEAEDLRAEIRQSLGDESIDRKHVHDLGRVNQKVIKDLKQAGF